MTRLTIVEQVVLAGFRNRKSINKMAKEMGISASYLYKLLDEVVPMTEAVETKIKHWLDNNQPIKKVVSEGVPQETTINTDNPLVKLAITEFPELAGLSDMEIASKIFGKCCRQQADRYKYRELLEQYNFASKIKF